MITGLPPMCLLPGSLLITEELSIQKYITTPLSSLQLPMQTFKPFRMGWKEREDCIAKNVEFRSNDIRGANFDMDATEQDHSYSVYWTLRRESH